MINFFYPEKHKFWLSTKIRGSQLAKFLGAKLNPKEIGENDTCVYIKPNTIDEYVPDGAWVDIADGGKFIKKLKGRPKIKIIVNSIASYNFLKDRLPNKIVYIPHHHLNWERQRRDRNKITTCGYTGSPAKGVREIYDRIGKEIKKIGLNFITCYKFRDRKFATEFYKKIDILVIGGWEFGDPNIHRAPTKIINAASFGVPAVAYPLRGYEEIEGYYLPARNMEELIDAVELLRDRDYYSEWVNKIVPMTEKHHIEKAVEQYRGLV
jgi:glycosyltransferase involved in cell wall biosynthesis